MIQVKTTQAILITLLLALAGITGILSASPVSAQGIKSGLCGGAKLSFSDSKCYADSADANKDGRLSDEERAAADADLARPLNRLITTFINIFSVIVGIIAVIMIIIGGLKFITSGGDSGKVSSAKTTVLYAIIGLIIVALAQIIVRFILSKV